MICFADVWFLKGHQRQNTYQPIVIKFTFDPLYNREPKYCCRLSPGQCEVVLNNLGWTSDSLKGRVQITEGDGWMEVKISNVQERDAGDYRCLVTKFQSQIYQDHTVTLSGKCNHRWPFWFLLLGPTPVLHPQRFQTSTVGLSRQSHQLSKPHQPHCHSPPAGTWRRTLLTTGIHSADVTFGSTGVSPFNPFLSSSFGSLDLPLIITISIAAMLLIACILSAVFYRLKSRKLGKHLSFVFKIKRKSFITIWCTHL